MPKSTASFDQHVLSLIQRLLQIKSQPSAFFAKHNDALSVLKSLIVFCNEKRNSNVSDNYEQNLKRVLSFGIRIEE